MNDNKLTPYEVSLYYDGLLDDERAREVERLLEADPEARRTAEAFALFDQALQPDLSDDEIDAWTSDTVQQVRERLARPQRRESGVLGWLLAPRFVMAACAVLVLFTGVFLVEWQPAETPGGTQIAMEDPNQSGDPASGKGDTADTPQSDDGALPNLDSDELKRQATLAMAGWAKSALSNGYQTLSKQAAPLKDAVAAIQSDPETAGTLDVIRAGVDALGEDGHVDPDSMSAETVARLEEIKRQQVYIGLGASLLGFVTVL